MDESSEVPIEFGKPTHEIRLSAIDISRQREQLANKLRKDHPGEWAIVSKGHVSRGSARQVRDRIRGRECWQGFEWSVCQHEDDPNLHRILAKAPGGQPFTPPPLPIQTVELDEISPTF